MNPTKLLIPLDGSPLAEQILPFAVKLANQTSASILLLQIVSPKSLINNSIDARLDSINIARSYLTSVLHTITSPTSRLHISENSVETLVVDNEPLSKIPEIASSESATMIMMATHGQSKLPRMVLGSTASKVVQHSEMPVILLRSIQGHDQFVLSKALNSSPETGFEKSKCSLLVTLDGSKKSELIIEPSMQLAKLMDATIHLLQVRFLIEEIGYDGILPDPHQIEEENTKRRTYSYKYLNKICDEIVSRGIDCKTMVRLGNPAEEIKAYANDLQPTLVVMATHARGQMSGLLIGSTATDVLCNLSIPVMMLNMRFYQNKKSHLELKNDYAVGQS